MPRRNDSQDGPTPLLPIALILALGFLHWRFATTAGGFLVDGALADPDAWTRLLRVLALHHGAAWRDPILPALSAPDGLSLHWTRPLDILILGPASVAMRFGVDARTAILWSGTWISPVLHLVAVLLGVWATRPLWPGMGAWIAGLLLLGSGAVVSYSVAGRADHHTLLLVAALLTLGAGLRAAVDEDRAGQAWLAGAAGGFGIWISPEALLTVAPLLAGFGLGWLITWDGRRVALQGARIAAGLALVLAIAVATERPMAEWGLAEPDKVSVQHLAIAIAAGACFLLAAPLGLLVPWVRLPVGLLLAGAAGYGLLSQWPDMLLGSLGGADAGAMALLLPNVQEMQPLRFGTRAQISDALMALGLVPLAALALLLGMEYGGWVRSGRWRAALIVGLALLVSTAAALMAVRFALDLAAPAAIGAAGLLILTGRLLQGAARYVIGGIFALLLFALPLGAGLLVAGDPPVAPAQGCPVAPLARFLAADPPAPAASVMFADNPNIGPELAWRTPYRQVAAPYHRGGAALLDLRRVFAATDDAEAAAALARRQVRLVLVCRDAPNLGSPWPAASLRRRLLAGEVPDGWSTVPLPSEVSASYMLFLLN
jgi:hypothetical protein